jgi:hypothetical protein
MSPPSDPILMSRRSLLRGAAAALTAWMLAACTTDSPNGGSAFGEPTPDDPDAALLQESVAVVTGLIDLVSRAIAELPTAARDLRAVLSTHRRHVEVLGSARRDPGASSPTTSETPAPLPRGRAAVLSVVVSEEIRASRSHLRHVARASSGPFAQLLASISAAEAQLATTLRSELP